MCSGTTLAFFQPDTKHPIALSVSNDNVDNRIWEVVLELCLEKEIG